MRPWCIYATFLNHFQVKRALEFLGYSWIKKLDLCGGIFSFVLFACYGLALPACGRDLLIGVDCGTLELEVIGSSPLDTLF